MVEVICSSLNKPIVAMIIRLQTYMDRVNYIVITNSAIIYECTSIILYKLIYRHIINHSFSTIEILKSLSIN